MNFCFLVLSLFYRKRRLGLDPYLLSHGFEIHADGISNSGHISANIRRILDTYVEDCVS